MTIDSNRMSDEEYAKTFRWSAVVTYRSANGPIEVDHQFEELEELHDLVERGPAFSTIVSIVVTLNRPEYPGETVETSELR